MSWHVIAIEGVLHILRSLILEIDRNPRFHKMQVTQLAKNLFDIVRIDTLASQLGSSSERPISLDTESRAVV